MKKKYKIVSPIRFFIFVLFSVLLISMLSYTFLGMSTTEASSVNTYRQIEVRENDTLWNIAETYCDQDNKLDTRKIVNQICEINNVDASAISPGDVLFVPVDVA